MLLMAEDAGTRNVVRSPIITGPKSKAAARSLVMPMNVTSILPPLNASIMSAGLRIGTSSWHAEPARELDADVGTPALDLPVLLDREIRQHQHADAELAARCKLARSFGRALRVGAGGTAEHRGSGDEYGGGRRSHAHVKPHDILPRRLHESSK